jgi:hypothetical protein
MAISLAVQQLEELARLLMALLGSIRKAGH